MSDYEELFYQIRLDSMELNIHYFIDICYIKLGGLYIQDKFIQYYLV